MADEMHADFSYMNQGGARDRLPKGRLLARVVWNLMPQVQGIAACAGADARPHGGAPPGVYCDHERLQLGQYGDYGPPV